MTPWTTEHMPPQSTTTTMKKGNTLMHHLTAALHTLGLTLTETATKRTRKEDGSVTIENVLWAVAIVGIVVVAITAYVTREAAKIT